MTSKKKNRQQQLRELSSVRRSATSSTPEKGSILIQGIGIPYMRIFLQYIRSYLWFHRTCIGLVNVKRLKIELSQSNLLGLLISEKKQIKENRDDHV